MHNHSFNVDVASEYKSIELAILIWHFQYWINRNIRLKRNEFDGRTWTYQTLQEIAAVFPYWSIKQVERLLNKAISVKILRKNNFNKSKFDRTLWYAFESQERFTISLNREMDCSESGNESPEIGRPIPDTLPDTLPDKEDIGSKPPQTPVPSFDSEAKKDRCMHVTTSDLEHQTLIRVYGEEITRKIYQTLSEWKQDTPRSKWKKSDFRSINRWVFEAVKEKQNKTPDFAAENKALALKIQARYTRCNNDSIVVGPDYLEHNWATGCVHVEFSDKKFKEKFRGLINSIGEEI
jgi:hypothetical protein